MMDTVLIEALQIPILHEAHLNALRYVVENDVSADVKFLAVRSLSVIHEQFNKLVTEKELSECCIKDSDTPSIIRSKCKKAYKMGIYTTPMVEIYAIERGNAEAGAVSEGAKTENLDYALSGFTGAFEKKNLPIIKKSLTIDLADDESGVKNEAKSSTERVRKYYRKHPEKVRKYLKDTVKDRAARNRDRAKAVKKHGKSKMKNHDVHHPKGPNGGSWRLAKKDHGPDKKNESVGQDKIVYGIERFVQFVANKLRLKEVPRIAIIPPQENMTSLGHFDSVSKLLMVVVEGRLLADVLRTVAHEMVHLKQDELGMIKNPSLDGEAGSEIENDANSSAGILMRQYGGEHPEIFVSEGLIMEGGAAGHLAHPFEDEELTFADMKEMVDRGLLGGLDAEAPVTEKLDGQNIAFTVRDGHIAFARNKGHVKNRGKNALDVGGIRQMFAGRGNIEKAFTGASEDLQAAVESLSPAQVKKLFGDGSKFMSLEVILPDTQNVIPYGKSVLVMHGTIEYDENGEEIGRSSEDGRMFAGAVTQVGANQQKVYGITGPHTIAFSDDESEVYQQHAERYKATLDRAAADFGLDDTATLAEYRQAWWARTIDAEAERSGIQLSKKERKGLIARWADDDKTFGVKDFVSPEKKKWFREFEKNSVPKLQKSMIKPIETTFLQAGADSLRRVTNFLSSNNPEASAQLKKDVLDAIKAIKDSNQPDKIAKLQHELARLNSIGMDKVVPSEGVVFIYNGKPYKFTGQFAPINQITGTFKFGMAPPDEGEPEADKPAKTEKSVEDLAQVSDKALDDKYKYGRSTPGNNFGWLSNIESARAAKALIDAGETDIEKIASAIHDGWNKTAMADYNGELKLDTPTPDEKKAKRAELAKKSYAELPEEEKEKDRVVARALVDALAEKDKESPEEETPEEEGPPKRTVAIFTGRFQPFHAGHYSIYQSLVKKFGKQNVYVASSNVQDAIKSPFPFTDKKEIMTRMFNIPEEMVVQVKNPYAPKEILEKLPEDTAYVTAVSQKDAERLGKNKKYFKSFDKVKPDQRRGYKDEGYFIVAPEMQLTVNGKNISGTQLRAVMGDPNITERAKREIFTKVYGKFDKKIFDKIVKVTTEAEEAKKLTDMHGKPKKAKKPAVKKVTKAKVKKAAPPKAMARAKSILKQKIENPKTGRKIYVATALSYDKTEPVRQAAEKLLKKAMTVREDVLTENTKSEKLKTYIYVRDYTDDEMKAEVSQYFDHEEMQKVFPTLAESEEDLAKQITDAPEEVLSKEDLESLANSDVDDVMSSKNPIATIKKIVEDDKKDLQTIISAFKSKEEMTMPIVIKMTDGYCLFSGNTKLSVLAALKYTMPVKVLAYDSPMSIPAGLIQPSKKKSDNEGGSDKGKFKKILQMKINNPETGNLIKIDTAMDYNKNHPAHKIALNTIRQQMKGLSSRAGIPKNKRH